MTSEGYSNSEVLPHVQGLGSAVLRLRISSEGACPSRNVMLASYTAYVLESGRLAAIVEEKET